MLFLFLFSPLPSWERRVDEQFCEGSAAGQGQPTVHLCVHRQGVSGVQLVKSATSHTSGGCETAVISSGLFLLPQLDCLLLPPAALEFAEAHISLMSLASVCSLSCNIQSRALGPVYFQALLPQTLTSPLSH